LGGSIPSRSIGPASIRRRSLQAVFPSWPTCIYGSSSTRHEGADGKPAAARAFERNRTDVGYAESGRSGLQVSDQIRTWLIAESRRRWQSTSCVPCWKRGAGDIASRLPGQATGEFYLVREKELLAIKTNQSLIATAQVAEDRMLCSQPHKEISRIMGDAALFRLRVDHAFTTIFRNANRSLHVTKGRDDFFELKTRSITGRMRWNEMARSSRQTWPGCRRRFPVRRGCA